MKRMKRKQRLIDSVREGFLRIRKNPKKPKKPLGLFAIMHPDGTFLGFEQYYDETGYGYTDEFYYDYCGRKGIGTVLPILHKKKAEHELDDFIKYRYEYDDTNDSDDMFNEKEYERLKKRFKLVKVPKRIIRKSIRASRSLIHEIGLSGIVYYE